MPFNYQTFINAAQLILNNLQNKRLFLKFCFSSASQSFRSPILGVNAKIGYQNYFNDFIGLAYYGIIKYNYAKAINQKVQQLSYGGGVELLMDFITTYSNKNSPTGIQTKRNFSSSFGIFGLGDFLKTHQRYWPNFG